MDDKIKYILRKLLCFALSMILAFSIIFLTVGALSIGFLQSESYIESHIKNNSDKLIGEINAELATFDTKVDLPVEAFTTALTEENIGEIVKTAVNNLLYNYSSDFSEDEVLYNSIKSSISGYCQNNGISTSESELSKAAALMVDEINETIGGSSTLNVKVFTFVQSNKLMYIICASVIFIIAGVVLLDLINFGRHRKYSYIGMALTTSGFVLTFSILFARHQDYLSDFKLSSVEAYSLGIAECIDGIMLYSMIIGIICLAVGIIMLLLNYNYFRKKEIKVKASREHNSQLRKEYMEQYNAKQRHDAEQNNDE
ncbi:MAG: hypothetical protein ACLUFN_01740 [Eubacterium sp.]